MEKCCRWCRYYSNGSGYCLHDEMFTVEDIDSCGTEIKLLDIFDRRYKNEIETHELENLGFKVINPECFSCCYWE